MKKILAMLLVTLMTLSLLSVGVSAKSVYQPDGLSQDYKALMRDSAYDMTLGSISAKYESNGKPGAISSGTDAGGVSYGAYQFSSKAGVPIAFANWCISSNEGVTTGNRLVSAYARDGQKYGANFNTEWTNLAAEDSQGFLVLQYKYVKAKYYDVVVANLTSHYAGFNVDNYSMAFKNVIWSRAVQHGTSSSVFYNAIDRIGGIGSHTEEELIRAIYAESACLVSTAPNSDSCAITASSANKYGMDAALLTGRYLRYFSRNSSDIQVSVFRRLTVNEPEDVFNMYTAYTGRSVANKTISPNIEAGNGGTDNDTNDSLLATILDLMATLFKMFFNFFVQSTEMLITLLKSIG